MKNIALLAFACLIGCVGFSGPKYLWTDNDTIRDILNFEIPRLNHAAQCEAAHLMNKRSDSNVAVIFGHFFDNAGPSVRIGECQDNRDGSFEIHLETGLDVNTMRYVIIHELGHAWGLSHNPSGIMRPQLDDSVAEPERELFTLIDKEGTVPCWIDIP
jgi:hypothetical protein